MQSEVLRDKKIDTGRVLPSPEQQVPELGSNPSLLHWVPAWREAAHQGPESLVHGCYCLRLW